MDLSKILFCNELNAEEKLIYITISYLKDIGSDIYIDNIKEITSMSRPRITRTIKSLEDKNLIKKKRRGLTLSNTYQINDIDNISKPEENLKSYIYIITDGENYKIGKANDVDKRLKSLSTASPKDLYVVDKYEVDDSCVIEVENQLHNKFKLYNLRNEWFDSGIVEYISDMKNIINNIVSEIKNERIKKQNKTKAESKRHSDIVNAIQKHLLSNITGEKIRFFTTQAIANGMTKEQAREYVVDFFSSIYTSAFDDIISKQFDNRWEDSVEKAGTLNILNDKVENYEQRV